MTIDDCLTVTIDGSKSTNYITSLHNQWHHCLTDRRPITSRRNQVNDQRIIPSTDVIQLTLTLKMTTAQVVETSVTVNNNGPIQDYVHPDDQTEPTFEMTPGFKPFTMLNKLSTVLGLFGRRNKKYNLQYRLLSVSDIVFLKVTFDTQRFVVRLCRVKRTCSKHKTRPNLLFG